MTQNTIDYVAEIAIDTTGWLAVTLVTRASWPGRRPVTNALWASLWMARLVHAETPIEASNDVIYCLARRSKHPAEVIHAETPIPLR